MSDNESAVGRQGFHGARTSSRSKYAKARVKAGLTYSDLRSRLGCSYRAVAMADKGQLPRHPAIRAAYLVAIGLAGKK